MKHDEITATINIQALKRVRRHLQKINVPGVSVFKVRGYGAHKNFFKRGWMQQNACIRIIAPENHTERIVKALKDAAYSGLSSDGIITVNSLKSFHHIRGEEKADQEG